MIRRKGKRTVTLGLTLRYNQMLLVLEPNGTTSALARKEVTVVEYPNGRLEVHYEGKVVPHLQYDKANHLVVNPPLDVTALETAAAVKKKAQEFEQAHLRDRAENHSYKPIVQWFHAACKVHDKETVAQMIDRDFWFVGKSYQPSALHLAARHGHDKVAEQLLTEFPQLAHIQCDGQTPLHNAVQAGHENIVKLLLLKAKPELAGVTAGEMGWTALHFAANSGRYDIAEILLEFQSDLAFDVTRDQNTVLHLACASPCRSQGFFEKLIEYDPSALRKLNTKERTPFQVAVRKNNFAAVEVLQRDVPFDNLFSSNERFLGKFRPLVEAECDELVETLGKGVVGKVFEFLGFKRVRSNQDLHITEGDYDSGGGGNPKPRKQAKRA